MKISETFKNAITTIGLILLGILFVWLGDLFNNCGMVGFSIYPGTAIAFYVAGSVIGIGASFAAMIKFIIKYKAN